MSGETVGVAILNTSVTIVFDFQFLFCLILFQQFILVYSQELR